MLTRPSRPGRVRGAAMLFFLLVALPMLVFGAALAADVTRIVITARQTSNAAEAAAIAGALQFKKLPAVSCPVKGGCPQYSYALDTGAAQAQGVALIDKAKDKTVRAIRAKVLSRSVSVGSNAGGTQRVTVTVRYQLTDLIFVRLFQALLGGKAPTVVLKTVRSADVCKSSTGTSPGTGTYGYCTRPTAKIPGI